MSVKECCYTCIAFICSGKLDKEVLKVWDFQKKIGIIYRLKQILNLSFEFPRVFCSLAASLSINLETEKQSVISKLKFKIVFWHIFLSPIEFSEKKWPLGLAVFQTFTYQQPTKYRCFWFYLAFRASRILNVHLQTAYQVQCKESTYKFRV